ncbi:cryptochrome/photolyase family protein [Sphingomonas ginkgonis]|uniref:Cryptochrome/photolyase family protein n=1 Tax=Sphingomonas ginkgonis TaxID=2315330 RepID=A0A429V909_9SPHN|nr:cryptochrome/photolyase family protein [Sphingomonas ginkgonis]RST30429.1 cryptochrome/photolyase family protein [Sphingomonas ginkgonis]
MPVLVPVLGDQLSHQLPSLVGVEPADTIVLMMEVWDETQYVKHHKQKIALIFSAMRHFAEELRRRGFAVDYVKLDDPGNSGSFTGEVERAVKRHRASAIRTVEAGERRVLAMQRSWEGRFAVPVRLLPDTRFLCSIEEFLDWAGARRELTMEYFYRDMRRRTGLLMSADGKPEGERWNYDADNRDAAPPGTDFPDRPRFQKDVITREVIELVEDRFGSHFGTLEGFEWPVTADEAEYALSDFLSQRLPRFGATQDAMLIGEVTMNHALVSTSINLGLLDPLEVCRRAEAEYRAGRAPLNAVEGFIRQVIGWREYVRGIYWWEGEGYRERNFLEARRKLPGFYWSGETDMKCLAECIGITRDNGFAHHIQRLMVLGNFAMLAGIDPAEVSDWYLVVYADAYEWVEMPNVIGMSQHADGGRMASKPYAASGAYIDRMSDYCAHCVYDVKKKVGPRACPFNSLYWDFLDRNRERLGPNRRLRNPYATWDRMSEEKRAAYRDQAARFLATLEPPESDWVY